MSERVSEIGEGFSSIIGASALRMSKSSFLQFLLQFQVEF